MDRWRRGSCSRCGLRLELGQWALAVIHAGNGTDEATDVNLATGRHDGSLGIAGPEGCRGAIATVGDRWASASRANELSDTGGTSSGTGSRHIIGTWAAGGIDRAAGAVGRVNGEAGSSCSEPGTNTLVVTSGTLAGNTGRAWGSGDAVAKGGGHIWTGSFETAAADVGKGRDAGSWDMTWGDNRAWRATGQA